MTDKNQDQITTALQPRMRRTLSGKTVPVDQQAAAWYQDPPPILFTDPVPRTGPFYVALRDRLRDRRLAGFSLNARSAARRARRLAEDDSKQINAEVVHRGAHYGAKPGVFPNRAAYRKHVRALKGVRRMDTPTSSTHIARVY